MRVCSHSWTTRVLLAPTMETSYRKVVNLLNKKSGRVKECVVLFHESLRKLCLWVGFFRLARRGAGARKGLCVFGLGPGKRASRNSLHHHSQSTYSIRNKEETHRSKRLVLIDNNQPKINKHLPQNRPSINQLANPSLLPGLLECSRVAHHIHPEIILHPDQILQVFGFRVWRGRDDDGLEELAGGGEAR
jgi:hypothetical protein